MGVAKTGVSGMAILVVPMIAMVSPAKESVGALLPMLIAGDILAVIYYRQHAQWGQLVKLVPGVAAGMLFGGMFLAQLDNESMRIFLGVFVLLLLVSVRPQMVDIGSEQGLSNFETGGIAGYFEDFKRAKMPLRAKGCRLWMGTN